MAFDLEQGSATQSVSAITTNKTILEKLLVSLAEARQGKLSADGMRVYVNSLSHHDISDVRGAVIELGTTPRQPGETAFPPLGNVLALIQRNKRSRNVAGRSGFCNICADTVHPGYSPLYSEHVSRVTGKKTRVATAMRLCECRQQL